MTLFIIWVIGALITLAIVLRRCCKDFGEVTLGNFVFSCFFSVGWPVTLPFACFIYLVEEVPQLDSWNTTLFSCKKDKK